MRYMVKAISKCAECNGTGIVQRTIWTEYRSTHPDPEIDEKWFAERGYQYPPDEEVTCYACNGTGEIETEVDLRTAIQDILTIIKSEAYA